jgi:hypothetical protein
MENRERRLPAFNVNVNTYANGVSLISQLQIALSFAVSGRAIQYTSV